MTESRGPRHLPVSHVISRMLLSSVVLALLVAAAVLAVLHVPDELAVGRIVWGSVRNWALPW
jgi:hypothetical protein